MKSDIQQDWEILLELNQDIAHAAALKIACRHGFAIGASSALKEIITSLGDGGVVSKEKIMQMLTEQKNFSDNAKFEDLLGK